MEDKIAKLSKDWFERDGDTYLRVRTYGRLDWEKSLGESTPYSAYILESPTTRDLITRAYPIASNMITSMNPPMKVKIRISNHEKESFTNGKILSVGTAMFDDGTMSNGEKLDVFIGTTIHEGCHLLYSNFGDAKSMGLDDNSFTLCNILEDERIEELCAQLKPGLASFLEKGKYYYYDKQYLDEGIDEDAMSLYHQFVSTFLKIIRYPKHLKIEKVELFADYLMRVKEVLTPYPQSTREVALAAKKIYEIIKDLYIDEATGKFSYKKSGEKGDGSGDEGEGSGEGATVIVKSGGKGKEDTDKDEEDKGIGETSEDAEGKSEDAEGKSEDAEGKSEDAEGKSEDAEDGAGKSAEGEDAEDDETDKKVLDSAMLRFMLDADKESKNLESITGRGETKLLTKDVAYDALKDNGFLGEEVEGLVELGADKDTIFERVVNNVDSYRESYERIKKYIPVFRRILKGYCKEYKLMHYSMRSGLLDTGKLAEAIQGVPTVYIREGEVYTDKVAVVVLIDESGSMRCDDSIRSARDAAILLNEAFGKIPNIELFIYGHSGDMRYEGATELFIYKEGDFAPRYALGSAKARSENRDGVAIYEVARRVRKLTQTPALMFVLSDGIPSASSYRDKFAIEDTREKVLKAEKLDIQVIQVCIRHSYNPGLMFKKFVILDNMGTLAKTLSIEIKRAIMGFAKTRIS